MAAARGPQRNKISAEFAARLARVPPIGRADQSFC